MTGGATETRINGGLVVIQVLALVVVVVDGLITTFTASQDMIKTSRAQGCFQISMNVPFHRLLAIEFQWRPLKSLIYVAANQTRAYPQAIFHHRLADETALQTYQ